MFEKEKSNFEGSGVVTLAVAGDFFFAISNRKYEFLKGNRQSGGPISKKISSVVFLQEMLFQTVNSISTYSAENAVSKVKLDICESADSVGKDSLGDAKIFFNFGCP